MMFHGRDVICHIDIEKYEDKGVPELMAGDR
jgi:hypothetical protein